MLSTSNVHVASKIKIENKSNRHSINKHENINKILDFHLTSSHLGTGMFHLLSSKLLINKFETLQDKWDEEYIVHNHNTVGAIIFGG